MTIERAAFTESLHPRGAGAAGGQFVAGGGGAAKAPASKNKGSLSFNGRTGTGYGKPGGDARVRKLQAALNKLGLTDGSGKKLTVDGKLGPKTTAAIKRAQRALGLKPDGVVTPGLLRKLTSAKSAKDLKKAPVKKAVPAKKAPAKKAPAKKAVPAKKAPAFVKKAPAKKAPPAKRAVPPHSSVR